MKTDDNYEAMRNEIKRLHQVCRRKDQVLNDCILTCNVLLRRFSNKLTPDQRKYYEKSINDFMQSLG